MAASTIIENIPVNSQKVREEYANTMDPFPNEKDHNLLGPDKYTFFVLDRIMDGNPRLLLSDHERLL